MNEQKSDSLSQEPISAPIQTPPTSLVTQKEHKSVLDSITKLWHKKNVENIVPKSTSPTQPQEPVVASPVPAPEVAKDATIPPPIPKTPHINISERIAHIFHRKPQEKHIESPEVSGVVAESSSNTPVDVTKDDTPFVIDERFARLLKHDTTYHSMLRSEDIKNIQLQLSMRYMLLMLAIFVVIAWVVNNRVIMFGFSDFPFLARARDLLFVLLTGLFSLTAWLGAAVWFRHKIGVLALRIVAVLLFIVVLTSIYLPFLA